MAEVEAPKGGDAAMREIDYDDLESERDRGTQYVRDKHCKGRCRMCFTCHNGVMGGYCEHFRMGHKGFKCDDRSIPAGAVAMLMQRTANDDE